MEITLASIVIWILIGLIAGWLAGEVTRSVGFGTWGNIVVGIIGAIVGVDPGGFVGEVVQAFIGALVFLAAVHSRKLAFSSIVVMDKSSSQEM